MRLAFCSGFPESGFTPQQGQSVKMQELKSVHNLCSGAVALVLKGREVFGQQMAPGRPQLTLQLVRRRLLRIATGAAMHFSPGKACIQIMLHHGCEQMQI